MPGEGLRHRFCTNARSDSDTAVGGMKLSCAMGAAAAGLGRGHQYQRWCTSMHRQQTFARVTCRRMQTNHARRDSFECYFSPSLAHLPYKTENGKVNAQNAPRTPVFKLVDPVHRPVPALPPEVCYQDSMDLASRGAFKRQSRAIT